MSDESFELIQLEWMWTKYAEHGGMPHDELKILEKAYDELKRWRESHASGDFNPDWCAASDALKEHLQASADERAGMQAAIVELREAIKWAKSCVPYPSDCHTNIEKTLKNTKKWSEHE